MNRSLGNIYSLIVVVVLLLFSMTSLNQKILLYKPT